MLYRDLKVDCYKQFFLYEITAYAATGQWCLIKPICFCASVCKEGAVQKAGIASPQPKQRKGMDTVNLLEVLKDIRAHSIPEARELCYASLLHNTTVISQHWVRPGGEAWSWMWLNKMKASWWTSTESESPQPRSVLFWTQMMELNICQKSLWAKMYIMDKHCINSSLELYPTFKGQTAYQKSIHSELLDKMDLLSQNMNQSSQM